MKIQLLYFDGCPTYQKAYDQLCEVLAQEQIKADIEQIAIESEEEAYRHRFMGSPSILVNGEDIDQSVNTSDKEKFGLRCRVYIVDGIIQSTPGKKMIQAAIRRGKDRGTSP